MGFLRRALRFAWLFLASGVLFPLGLLSRALHLVGARATALRLGALAQRWWGRSMNWGLGVRLDVEAAPPPGRYLVVANHLSYLDITVLATLFPGRFVAKAEIARWPVLGQLAGVVGTLWVDQTRRRDVVRVGAEIQRTLDAGVSVVLFPEGRSTAGFSVERLHAALLASPAKGSIPCLAVTLGYRTPGVPWTPASTVCWWGGMDFWRHAWGVIALPEVTARVRWPAAPRVQSDRKLLAEELRADLLARFEPHAAGPVAPDSPYRGLFEPLAREAGPGLETPGSR